MRVLILAGNDQYWGFGNQLKISFEKLGIEAKLISYRKFKFHKTYTTNLILHKYLKREISKFGPDILLVNKGESLHDGFIREISKEGIITVNWTLDDPFGEIDEFNRIGNIDEYDYFFVFDPYYLSKLREINPNSYYLPCAACPEIHREVIPLEHRKYEYDISFIGSYEKNREEIFDYLSKIYNLRVSGFGWKNKQYVDRRLYLGRNMCVQLNLSKINLNIHAHHSFRGVNLRTFEIPCTRSFQICDNISEIRNLFHIGKEIVCYDSVDDLVELIEYYLDNGGERYRIIKQGYDRVIKEHTLLHRVGEILRIAL